MENNTILTDEQFGSMLEKLESMDSNYVKLTEIFKEQHPIGRTKPVIRRFLRGVFNRVVTKDEVSDFMNTLVAQQLYDDYKKAEQGIILAKFKEVIFRQMRERNRTFVGVTLAIESLREIKQEVIGKGLLKNVNHDIQKLVKLSQSLIEFHDLETPRDRWGISIIEKTQDGVKIKESSYVYEPEQRKKTGSGDKKKTQSDISIKRMQKNRKW